MSAIAKTLALAEELQRRGFHVMTPWWADQLRAFDRSGARILAASVGRLGMKSSVGEVVGLGQAMFGSFEIGRGERHFFVFASVKADEARTRVQKIESYLTALGIPHTRAADVIELSNVPTGIMCVPANIGSVSGPRSIGFFADEVAKWRDKASVNPAVEIAASARAMAAGHPDAKEFYFSSPTVRDGFHYDLIRHGTDARQMVAKAPSWVANPSISEARTRELEPDPVTWSREYLAEPQDSAQAAFDSELVDAAMTPRGDLGRVLSRVCSIDPSRGGGDGFAYAFLGWNRLPDGRRVFVVDAVRCFEGKRRNLQVVVDSIAAECQRRGVGKVISDQGGGIMVGAAFRRHGLRYFEFGWSVQSKARAISTLRVLLNDGLISLPRDPKLRSELLTFESGLTATGLATFNGKMGSRDDRCATLITAAHAENARKLTGSPSRHRDPAPWAGGTVEMARSGATDFDNRLDDLVRRSGGRVDSGSFGSGFGSGGY